jgi:ubiquinone/menaquinone biosynthesis C-methylase UbiE
MKYYSGSISGKGNQYLDLLALPYPDQSVDVIYCCHVLNSMPDDQAAMREVRRVLRPDGLALLQVPAFHTGKETLEAKSLEERIALFGDEGIFRAYTPLGYLERLNAAGLEAEVYLARSLSDRARTFHALHDEVLHICRPS